jgi:glycosyltransferase involved in cell wall biosynthesis
MHLTVGICTWNRAELLDGTLASLAEVAIPAGVTWDVIVANNNSTDPTEDVLDRHAGRLPLIRLFVPQQGKSHALNQVVERLAGDLVLWTDDDVRFSADWITSYVDAARRWPKAAFFGGRVTPRFPAGEPDWLRPAWRIMSDVCAARELGDEPFTFDCERLPFGANMAVRVAVQKRYRYDPELGRRGDLLLSCEETALMKQWLSEGYVGMWVPQSRVEHMITPDRCELDYVRRFFFDLAKSKRPQGRAAWPPLRLFRGVCYACRAMKYQALSVFYPQATRPDRWMKYLARISYCWGRVESQWGVFPRWLKPAAVRRLEEARPTAGTRSRSRSPDDANADELPVQRTAQPRHLPRTTVGAGSTA